MAGAGINFAVLKCPDVVILSGATRSNIIPSEVFGDAQAIALYAPATLAETITFEVTHSKPATTGSTWVVWNNNVADVSGPAAGKGVTYVELDFMAFRLVANGAVAADRTFHMTKKA